MLPGQDIGLPHRPPRHRRRATTRATAFDRFVARYVVKVPRAERAAALVALREVVLEAHAVERRRLCTDRRYFAAAVTLTAQEIARVQRPSAARPRVARPARRPRLAATQA